MNIVDYQQLKTKVIGASVPKPSSATLYGHAVAEPFEKYIYTELRKFFPNKTYRQHEYLNDLFSKHPKVISYQERLRLFDSPSVMFLLSRGKSATTKWSMQNLFEDKQNDTADILIVDHNFYEIIDIKTRNSSKKAQPPNIISAYKLAQTCSKVIDNQDYDTFTIQYFGIDWELRGANLVCTDAHAANLFKARPATLYINWAAGMQIQFNIEALDQSFEGNMEEWGRAYLGYFVLQAKQRANNMIEQFVKPFEKYI